MNDLEDRRKEAARARTRLETTFNAVRNRTRPEALLATAKEETKRQAMRAGAAALSNGRFRPVLALGIAATSLAYLFRNPILKALNKRLGEGEKND